MSPTNITLIGMPASGKSTLGVLLAKALSMGFVDTDLLIQAHEGQRLHEIQQRIGMDAFQTLECDTVAALDCQNAIIAPGGSAVYCNRAMGHLRALGKIVYLNVPLAEIERRIGDLAERGVVMPPGMSLADLYRERAPLYQKHADHTIDCAGKSHEQLIAEIIPLR